MQQSSLKTVLDAAAEVARAAGDAIQDVAGEDPETAAKADGSPVTRADLASHAAIAAGLAQLRPKLPVLSEEGDPDISAGPGQTFWCVDPLDGTKEFVNGFDEYTVNIALVEQGVPILGVVYLPAQDALYYAARGQGAWKVDLDGGPHRIAPRRFEKPQTAVVSRSHLSEQTERFLERMGIRDVIRHGSSMKICAVAEGRADVYPRHGPTCLWDTAAGAALARAAGCEVVDLQGRPLSYRPENGIKHAGFVVYPAACRETFAGELA